MMKRSGENINIHNGGPLVSVVMPNYNTPEDFLRRAIDSILGQTYDNIELIIIDDASTGDDVGVIRSYSDRRIVLLRNDVNRHVAFTLNRGLEIAQGKYIARMDSDDICLPRRIEEQVAFMQRRSDIDILCAQARFFGERNGVFAPHLTNAERMRTELFFNCAIAHPTVMFRADFVRRYNLRYQDDIEFRAAEDYELWTRCASLGRLCEYPHVLLNYRVHGGQVSAAANSRQQAGTWLVRAGLLIQLRIVPDEHEAMVHDHLCNGSADGNIPPKETESWARRLLDANDQFRVYPQRLFARAVIRRCLVVMVKSMLNDRVTPGQLLKLPLMKRALNPVLLPDYLAYFLFSRRLNRVSKQ